MAKAKLTRGEWRRRQKRFNAVFDEPLGPRDAQNRDIEMPDYNPPAFRDDWTLAHFDEVMRAYDERYFREHPEVREALRKARRGQ